MIRVTVSVDSLYCRDFHVDIDSDFFEFCGDELIDNLHEHILTELDEVFYPLFKKYKEGK